MGFASKLVFGGAAAGAALAYYVSQRHERTGESYLGIVKSLPSDAQRWVGETRRRATLALEDGRSAARERETEITQQLAATDPSAAAVGLGGVMAERINLEVPADPALSDTVLTVVAGICARARLLSRRSRRRAPGAWRCSSATRSSSRSSRPSPSRPRSPAGR